MADPRRQIEEANAIISTVALLLGGSRETFEQFMLESERMDSVGAILNPTLFMSSERRATEALLKPLYRAALDFLRTHDRVIGEARAALDKVNANG
ncbi:hypothetical protein MRS76_20555 [Rhizobiaceae bacterium n13]|uniref:hypothetical protein n=1 Tax=Ferirhizobium litorale TaxID=2927786 RepID=UPI0024B2C4E8|nr:hypothetical protein [Fererhizobium litorale]MDI7864334.1 hypothetical protein [Fererhizobium litorale]